MTNIYLENIAGIVGKTLHSGKKALKKEKDKDK